MALLTANKLGVYVLDYVDSLNAFRQTSPIGVQVNNTSAAAGKSAYDGSSPPDGAFYVVNDSDVWLGDSGSPNLYYYDTNSSTTVKDSIRMAYAATNSTLDFSTNVDEVVAKGAQCKSSTFTSIGSNTWSVTVDGLISNDSTDSGGSKGSQIFDICNRGEYVIVKYQLDSTDSSGTSESNAVYIGQGVIESANISGSFDSTQTYTATIRGYGKLYKYLH